MTVNEEDGYAIIKRDLDRIKQEFVELEEVLLKRPVTDDNYKAALLIRALEAFMFDIENGMLKCAKELAKHVNECSHHGSMH